MNIGWLRITCGTWEGVIPIIQGGRREMLHGISELEKLAAKHGRKYAPRVWDFIPREWVR
jgi:hypothetical protein